MKETNIESSRQEKQRAAIRVTLIGSVVDTILGAIKVVVGLMYHSNALVVDGVHSFSDLLTDGLVLILGKISHEAPDKNHPYGHERFETIGSAALGSILMATGGALFYESVKDLASAQNSTEISWPTFAVAILSLLSKEIIFQYSFRVGKELKSKLLMANAWHSRTDALSSLIVLIGLILGKFGAPYFDDIAALIVSLMIAKVGWDFMKESLIELTDTSVNREMIKKIQYSICSISGVKSSHALRTRRMGSKILVDVNIEVTPKLTASEGHEISEWVSHRLIDEFEDIEDVTVHLDVQDDLHDNQLLPLRNEIFEALKDRWKNEFSFEGVGAPKEIRLQYMKNKIDLEFFFDELPQDINEEKIKMLKDLAQDLEWFGDLFFFTNRF